MLVQYVWCLVLENVFIGNDLRYDSWNEETSSDSAPAWPQKWDVGPMKWSHIWSLFIPGTKWGPKHGYLRVHRWVMYIYLMQTASYIFSAIALTSKYLYISMLMEFKPILLYTHLKRRRASVFTVHAVSGHVDLMSLAELRVDEAIRNSRVGIPSRGGGFFSLVLPS